MLQWEIMKQEYMLRSKERAVRDYGFFVYLIYEKVLEYFQYD